MVNKDMSNHALPPPNPILIKKVEDANVKVDDLKVMLKKLPEIKPDQQREKMVKQPAQTSNDLKRAEDCSENGNDSDASSYDSTDVFDYGIQAYYEKQQLPLVYKRLETQQGKSVSHL